MKASKAKIRPSWKAKWLIEFCVAFVVLGAITKEALLASVGIIVALTLAVLASRFYMDLTDMRDRLQLDSRLLRTKIVLGESVEGELWLRNESSTVARVDGISATLDKELWLMFQDATNELIQPGNEVNFVFAVTPLTSGRFQITSFSLTLTDSRHLFAAELVCEQVTRLEIFPRIVQPLTPLSLYAGGSDILHKIPLGVDYAGIREYTAGDEGHKVEWKATARLRRLMVKEFHPETETNLQILIDTGRTMHQQSYVGTRLDEALAVAQLLTQSATALEKRLTVYFYDENELVKKLTPTVDDQQFFALRDFIPTRRSTADIGVGGSYTQPVGLLRSALLPSERVLAYLHLLKHMLGRRYGNAGVYKAIQAATAVGHENVLIVLTDLETNVDALIEAASTYCQRGAGIIVSQIGAAWRLRMQLTDGYAAYHRNLRILQNLWGLGLSVFDARPEILVDKVLSQISLPVTLDAHRIHG